MASQGPKYSTSSSQDASGAWSWTSLSNAGANDSTYATAQALSPPYTGLTHKATFSGFAFSLPDSTVDGISVLVERKGSTVRDSLIQLVKSGTPVGNNKSTGANWSGFDTDVSYGGASDLWGSTWEYTEINASNFGVVFQSDFTAAGTAYVDRITVTVYYTVAATGQPTVARFGGTPGMRLGGPTFGRGW